MSTADDTLHTYLENLFAVTLTAFSRWLMWTGSHVGVQIIMQEQWVPFMRAVRLADTSRFVPIGSCANNQLGVSPLSPVKNIHG